MTCVNAEASLWEQATRVTRTLGRAWCKLDHTSWIKIDQLDVTCFIISLFTAQHISNVSTFVFRSLWLIVDLSHGLYCSGLMCVGVTVWFVCTTASACIRIPHHHTRWILAGHTTYLMLRQLGRHVYHKLLTVMQSQHKNLYEIKITVT